MAKQLYFPNGTAASGTDLLYTDPAHANWDYSGLRVFRLAPGESKVLTTGSDEIAVLPLAGGADVEIESHSWTLAGRDGVFSGVTDFVYAPIDAEVKLTATRDAEIAICAARATRRIDPYYVAAQDIPIEVRGGGRGTRQINNFLSADMFDADTLIAVEVITPEGNWSSYPPHKHDEFSPDEVALEEIYYFRIDGPNGVGFFNMYTADGEIDVTELIRDGDLVLVPRGYHGPAAATPGHHMYYLNVMAGPSDQRVWKFCDDPDHHWARAMLDGLDPDARLPLYGG